jgi:mannose/fructose/N-acetylgalactosamine-specific phosphotransferase system component IIC
VSEWLLLLLLGGVVGLDATAFPQVMISRPLVAGTLAGALFGQPAAGALVGGLIEVFSLPILPMGATRYPEAGVAAVAAATAYVHAAAAPLDGAALLLALLLALVWERVAGRTTNWLRETHDRYAIVEPLEAPTPALVERRHIAAVALDFARGAIVTGAGTVAGVLLVPAGAAIWGAPPALALAAIVVAACAAVASALSVFGGWQDRRIHFLAGALVGAVLILIR